MKGNNPVHVVTLLNAVTIAQAGSVVVSVDISQMVSTGNFSLELTVAAVSGSSPSITTTLKMSNSGSNFITPTGITVTLSSAFLKTSGIGGDGKEMINFSANSMVCKYLQFTFTENNAGAALVSAYLAVQ